ncbi:MAG TPA: isoprenylcysteine carboxylmethyltransferase family protein [Opitutaceae bacterium]|nr:isoprenylcysteine carboxylmethyltransferase family protein [Opitutaceae bacterium]
MTIYSWGYCVLWAIFAGYWLLRWGGNKRTVRTASATPRLVVAACLVLLLLDRRILPPAWDRPLLRHTPALELAGLLICAAGVALGVWARRTLGTNWSANPTIKEGHQLVESGPYRLVRHPIYSALYLAVLGSALGGSRPLDALVFAAVAVSFWFKLRVEEKLMLQQFPAAYPEYRRRTKAVIPWVL